MALYGISLSFSYAFWFGFSLTQTRIYFNLSMTTVLVMILFFSLKKQLSITQWNRILHTLSIMKFFFWTTYFSQQKTNIIMSILSSRKHATTNRNNWKCVATTMTFTDVQDVSPKLYIDQNKCKLSEQMVTIWHK